VERPIILQSQWSYKVTAVIMRTHGVPRKRSSLAADVGRGSDRGWFSRALSPPRTPFDFAQGKLRYTKEILTS